MAVVVNSKTLSEEGATDGPYEADMGALQAISTPRSPPSLARIQ